MMDPFDKGFFHIHKDTHGHKYCELSNTGLILFTSLIYMSGVLTSIILSACSAIRRWGHRKLIIYGAFLAFVGPILESFFPGHHLWALVVGRIIRGTSYGLLSVAIPSYLTEMAAAEERGWVVCSVQAPYKLGALFENIIAFAMKLVFNHGDAGWRITLSVIPILCAIILGCFAAFALPDVTSTAAATAEDVSTSPRSSLGKKKYAPNFIMGFLVPLFTQLTGVNVINPIVFQAIGFSQEMAFAIEMISCIVGVFSAANASFWVDKKGRKVLFMVGGLLMIVALLVLGVLVETGPGVHAVWSKTLMWLAVMVYAFGFGISWGPLGILTLNEMYLPEIRWVAQPASAALSMFFSGSMSGVSLPLLCWLKHYIFYLFAAMVLTGTLLVWFFLPEMKGIPLDEIMQKAWKLHWWWRRFYNAEEVPAVNRDIEIPTHGEVEQQPPCSGKDHQTVNILP